MSVKVEPGDWVQYIDGCNKRLAVVEEVEPQVIFVKGSKWAIDRNDIIESRPPQGENHETRQPHAQGL